ncbi:hypothetical protein [Enterobacter ludwigii]
MIKIKKTYFGTLLITTLLLSVCCIVLFYNKPVPALQCHANIRYNTIDNGKMLKSNMTLEIFFNAGYASVTGEIQLDDTQYSVRRDIYFKKVEQSGATVLTKEIILPGDNVSDELWERFFIPRPYNTPFFSHFEKLTGNLYYVGLASSPYFICAGSS